MPNMEADKSIKSTYKKYKNILDNSPFAILEINANTEEISYFNTKFLNISGYNSEYLLNKSIKNIIWEEDCEILFKTTEGKKVYIRIDCKNGTTKWLSGSKLYKKNKIGEITEITLWLKDIIFKKQTEELIKEFHYFQLNQVQKSSQSKSEFLKGPLFERLKIILDSISQFPYLFFEQVFGQLNEGIIKIPSDYFEENKYILIITRYDNQEGAIAEYISVPLLFSTVNEKEIKNRILNPIFDIRKTDIVFLPFKDFFVQAYKFEIKDPEFLRGKNQKYGLVFIRNKGHPFIPFQSFEQIKQKFLGIGNEKIIKNDKKIFQKFFDNIKSDIYPLNPHYLLIQSNIDEIQENYKKFLQEIKSGQVTDRNIIEYVEMLLNSFYNLLSTLKEMFSISLD